jgi:hypothetical protein
LMTCGKVFHPVCIGMPPSSSRDHRVIVSRCVLLVCTSPYAEALSESTSVGVQVWSAVPQLHKVCGECRVGYLAGLEDSSSEELHYADWPPKGTWAASMSSVRRPADNEPPPPLLDLAAAAADQVRRTARANSGRFCRASKAALNTAAATGRIAALLMVTPKGVNGALVSHRALSQAAGGELRRLSSEFRATAERVNAAESSAASAPPPDADLLWTCEHRVPLGSCARLGAHCEALEAERTKRGDDIGR